jgi:hypothetical protein
MGIIGVLLGTFGKEYGINSGNTIAPINHEPIDEIYVTHC